MKKYIISLLFLPVFWGCKKNSTSNGTIVTPTQPNILFIIADDMGKDATNGFSEGAVKPFTPNIDGIMNNGLSFTNFWVYPTCTPTRASIITGKYGYRTQVKGVGDVLPSSEVVLQKYMNDNTGNSYATSIIGKWHLSGSSNNANPELFGIDYYAGLIRGAVTDYYQWSLTEDGRTTMQTEYATTVFTNLAVDWVKKQSKPWFLWLAYNAPHTPFHVPPSHMHKQGALPAYTNGANPLPYYMASIEAMDYEIGRFLDSLKPEERNNTVIIFIGDNGTANQVAQSPYASNKVKNTLYQGGINTPLFISGPGVTRKGTDANLICGTDLFATISQLAGVQTSEINDSKSFKSLLSSNGTIRKFQYTEMDDGTTDRWTIRNATYKIIADNSGTIEMYNLSNDPYELNDLLKGTLSANVASEKLALETELSNIRK